MQMGDALVADVDRCELKPGEGALWWMGQHSFIVKLGRTVLYIDPFLTLYEGRQVPPMVTTAQVGHAHFILGTHDHADHIDRPAWPGMAQAAPQARFVVPELLREKVARELEIPAGRFIGLDDGQTVAVDGLRLSAVAAAHEFFDQDAATGRYPYLGYVIEGNGFTLYHAGDTCIYEGMQTKLKRWHFDVALLPINGRDAKRYAMNCMGNMTFQEAADLAGVLRPGLTIPTHYDMFAFNAENPASFLDYMRVKHPRLNTRCVNYGERLVLQHTQG